MAKLFIANWKMQLSPRQAERLALLFKKKLAGSRDKLVVCPDFLSLPKLAPILKASNISLGAQDCAPLLRGAQTGEISALDLKALGVSYVIIGHSERRSLCQEDSQLIKAKLKASFSAGLKPVLCIGENEAQKKQGKTKEFLRRQIKEALSGLKQLPIIAYEPLWAIGSGRPASGKYLEEVIAFIYSELSKISSKKPLLLYGGSVDSNFQQPVGIDGFLVGGASLKIEEFKKICGV